ncbi:MAG TPA: OmpA family protein [Vicinamibacterales bacterium]|jgi:outer membrane protein OmpA-like peptidoglycan-associated protein|nr:OmpA family protein [Vicinamibacterales bacterium]
MQKSLIALTMFAVATAGSTACATKGYVRTQVGQVSSKVDSLTTSLEETQERTKQNEAKITQVDEKAGAAGTAADQAGSAARLADQKAAAAGDTANSANTLAQNVDKAQKKIVYEVVLNESQGNFKFGDSSLPAAAKARIDELIAQIKADPKGAYFEIEGHTDNVGDKVLNEKLGLERAEAVKRYLYEQHQIPLHKMNVISYGEDKPAVPNNSRDNRAQNRRVVIRVLA